MKKNSGYLVYTLIHWTPLLSSVDEATADEADGYHRRADIDDRHHQRQ